MSVRARAPAPARRRRARAPLPPARRRVAGPSSLLLPPPPPLTLLPARPPACPLRRASLPCARVPRSPGIEKIKYEGPESNNPLAFKHYDAKAVVHGRTMEDWCRFSVCYWHTFRGLGADPFGGQTLFREWDDGSNSMDNALRRVDAAFEFMTKLGS